MGWPILGDPQYNSPESVELSREYGAKSQFLCAKSLELVHPITDAPMVVHSRLDAVLE